MRFNTLVAFAILGAATEGGAVNSALSGEKSPRGSRFRARLKERPTLGTEGAITRLAQPTLSPRKPEANRVSSYTISTAAAPVPTRIPLATVSETHLVIARDQESVEIACHGLHSYAIPCDQAIIPKAGAPLPQLRFSELKGYYAGIIIVDGVSYEYEKGTWKSALTDEQWKDLFTYQVNYGVRMVRLNEFPGPNFGTTVAGQVSHRRSLYRRQLSGSLNSSMSSPKIDQQVRFIDTRDFPTAGLNIAEGVSSKGLWHYPAVATEIPGLTTRVVAEFAPNADVTNATVAAVINSVNGREQMVWFMSFAPWSSTSSYLEHAHIHWMTRGLFLGRRKVHLSPQIDDIGLASDLYSPAGATFRLRLRG